MRILCPLCGFAREMDETKIPPRAQMATCPKCAHKFRFRVVDDLEPQDRPAWEAPRTGDASGSGGAKASPGGEQGPDRASGTQDDPMAAQRAAAAAAWKRLQGQDRKPGAEAPPLARDSQPQDSQIQDGQPKDSQMQDGPAQATPGPDFPPPRSERPGADATGGFGPTPVTGSGGQAWPQPGTPKSTGSPVPFEDLPRHGFFPGLWGTIRLLLTRPSEFFRSMPVGGGMAKPLIFHVLLAEFMVACQYVWSLAGIGATAQYMGSPELMDMGLGGSEAAPVLLLVVYPLMLVLRLMLMTGVIHLLLRLLRSGGSGAEATFRVLSYSAAPLALGVFPVIGPLVGGIWSIVLTILGLKEAHRTGMATSMFAVFVPILLLLAAIVGLMQGMVQAG